MDGMKKDTDPLGELLVSQGVLDRAALEDALAVQREGFPLASVVYLLGLSDEEPLVRVLSSQVGIPGVLLERSILSVHNLRDVPEEIARRYGILPLYRDHDSLFVGVGEHLDPEVLHELSIITGREVIPHVALHAILARAIRQSYALLSSGEAYWFGRETGIEDLNDPQGLLTPVLDVDELPGDVVADPLDVTDPNLAVPVSPEDIVLAAPLPANASGEKPAEELEDAAEELHEPDLNLGGTLPAPKRILLGISDDRLREQIQALLAAEGHDIESVPSGLEAIRMLREAPPDLLLLSVLLPDIQGYDICRRIKASARYGSIPVILLSSTDAPRNRDAALSERYRADAVLRSPVTPTALLGTVNRLLTQPRPHPVPLARDDDQKLFDAAIAHYRDGRTTEAIQALEKGLALDPFSPRTHFVLANILQHEGRHYEAIAAYERTVELRPNYFPALTRLAYLQYKQGFLPRALAHWRRAVQVCEDRDQQARIQEAVTSLERELANRRTEYRSQPVSQPPDGAPASPTPAGAP